MHRYTVKDLEARPNEMKTFYGGSVTAKNKLGKTKFSLGGVPGNSTHDLIGINNRNKKRHSVYFKESEDNNSNYRS